MSTLGRTKFAVLEVGVHENIPNASSEGKANKAVLLVLQIISGIMIVAFTLGFAFIVHHRIKKHIVTPQVPDSSNTSKFDSMGRWQKTRLFWKIRSYWRRLIKWMADLSKTRNREKKKLFKDKKKYSQLYTAFLCFCLFMFYLYTNFSIKYLYMNASP